VLDETLPIVFLAAAGLLWVSLFGYVGLLIALAGRRAARRSGAAPADTPAGELPAVAVVVPVRNEERFVAAKLADLRRSDYPADRLTTVVVDGGSVDATGALVETERARGAAVELLRVNGARGKAEQLNAVLGGLTQDVIVVTDVDAALDPACIRELVRALLADPSTAVVGARVRPATRLLEERIHWGLLNLLWWLEGEALAAAAVSGVCYAMRRSAIALFPADCTAEDVRLALTVAARGHGVRLSRRALATELRVPQTARELLRFRRRRGAGYVRELVRAGPPGARWRWHLVRLLRLYHFLVTPVLAAGTAVAGLALCATAHWQLAAAAMVAFALPALAALFASPTLGSEGGRRWWRLGLAAGRLAGLTWLSLLALPRAALPPLAPGD
jgi:cellulose synthase/poly-beta-1,6-N-acetylglucosamine synthase-like glycosyltransferase